MNRRHIPFAIASGLGVAQLGAQNEADSLLAILRASRDNKKGITLHVHGQSIAMIVTAISANYVEGRSQQSSRIVVRLSSIDAAQD